MANLWMNYNPAVHFPPSKFIEAVRVRCGRPATTATFCTCGVNLTTVPTHPVSCRMNSGYTAVHRHNEILAAIASVSRSYGFTLLTEPRCYADEDNRRPDILFCLGPRSIAVDLTVVDPTCTENAPACAANTGIAAAKAARDKVTKHAANVEALGHSFHPWACETFGHLDETFVSSVRFLARELPKYARGQYVRDIIYATSSLVQSGNAGIINAWRCRTQRHTLLS